MLSNSHELNPAHDFHFITYLVITEVCKFVDSTVLVFATAAAREVRKYTLEAMLDTCAEADAKASPRPLIILVLMTDIQTCLVVQLMVLYFKGFLILFIMSSSNQESMITDVTNCSFVLENCDKQEEARVKRA